MILRATNPFQRYIAVSGIKSNVIAVVVTLCNAIAVLY